MKRQKHFQQEQIYQRLEERNFQHFIKPLYIYHQEEVFPYIHEKNYRNEEKAIDMMHVLSLLQNKTTFYKEISLDEMKEFYEEKKGKINYLIAYYQDLEELFFKEVFPSPTVYLLQRNLSLLFSSLFFAKETLEEWYQLISSKKYQRQVLVHHRYELSHLLEGETPLLVSLDEMTYGSPVEDFVYFMQKHCLELEMTSLYQLYQQKYPYQKEEFLLLSLLLAIPPQLKLDASYQTTVLMATAFQKMNCCREFLLKQNERHQHEHK